MKYNCLLLVVDQTLLVSSSLFLYGNDIVERNRTEPVGFRRTWIDPNRILPSGYLSRYFIYANPADRLVNVARPSPTVTRIQIWRPASGAQSPDMRRYTLVWERRVQLNTATHGAMYTVSSVRSHSVAHQILNVAYVTYQCIVLIVG